VAAVAERFESGLWQTSSLLLSDGTEAVLVDPAVSAAEVAQIAANASELGAEVTHVLATHADWDHVCGFAAFPDAAATVSEATAARLLARTGETATAERAAASGVEVQRLLLRLPRFGHRRLLAAALRRSGLGGHSGTLVQPSVVSL
jgi:glyoxylase-like metal-dependent hydrolase (beta-lactamase superfamily II)